VLASPSFAAGLLSAHEMALRAFCRRMRTLIPQAREQRPPAPGWSGRTGRFERP
jgi:hypothetical protein